MTVRTIHRWPRVLRTALLLGGGTLAIALSLMLSSCETPGSRQVSGYALSQRSTPDQLTLLSWNIHKSGHPDLIGDLEQAITTHDPDLLFLQEAQPGRNPEWPLGGVLAPAWRAPLSGNGGVGVFTASRGNPVDAQAIRSPGREFGITVPKSSLLTRHAIGGGRILLAVNVHAMNFERGQPRRFARQLQVLHAAMTGHQGPMIFAGDFNAWNSTRDRILLGLTESLGLTEVAPFAGSRKTGDQGSVFVNSLLGIDPSLPLDRIFYRDLTVASARVLNLESSDHAPLLVTFDCRPAPAEEG